MSSIGRRLEGSFPPAVAASSSERDPSSNHYLCPQQQHQHQNQQQQRYQHQQQYQQTIASLVFFLNGQRTNKIESHSNTKLA
mmetsp:Transcript_52109/g.60197  ORF Transcript_52109/g.60197 Transcript_52109/m.60197 type:complete len:82 (-) Transcript_52109:169-414(-)